MSNGHKLYVNKPKKSQRKQSQPSSSSASMASSTQTSSVGATPPPHTPQPPKESFARRYRFVWPLLLAVNFTVGAYLFMRTKKKDNKEEASSATGIISAPISSTAATATVPDQTSTTSTATTPPPIIELPKPREPIPEKEQIELFKWILEEKRKLKPKDSEEKRCIDEEKALLKQVIRANQLPSL